MSTKSTRRTYYPAKTFDHHLAGLARLYTQKAWFFSGIDVAELEKDAAAARKERIAHDALLSAYLHCHEAFGVAQAERHTRFSSALFAARGAFRKDKAIMAELDRFKRSVKRRDKKQPKAE